MSRFRLVAGFTVVAASLTAQQVRVIRFAESIPFKMGEVTSRRIVNLSISQDGAGFAQHVHDSSDDTILVLQGEANLRQGDAMHLFKAGESAFGARDSKRPGAAQPEVRAGGEGQTEIIQVDAP